MPATRNASSSDCDPLRRGSHAVSYRPDRSASTMRSAPPRHSVTSSPVSSTWTPPGTVPNAAVHVEERRDLVDDVVEVPRLQARRRLHRVAVHRVAHPHDFCSGCRHLLHDRRQHVTNASGAHPTDQRQPPGYAVGIESLDQQYRVVGRHSRAELDRHRIRDRRGKRNVCTVELPGPLPHPQQMTRQVVHRSRRLVDASERLLVVEQQRLVAREEFDAVR